MCMNKIKLFSIKTWSKIGVEVTNYNDKKWIHEKHLKTATWL